MNYLEDRLKPLAETHLADYDLDDAVDALVDVDDCTQFVLPDALLVAAARRHLETTDDPEGRNPRAALQAVLFDDV